MQERPERAKKPEAEHRRNASAEGAVESGFSAEASSDFTATSEVSGLGTPNGLSDGDNNLLQLQQTRGNAYVRRMLARAQTEGSGAPTLSSQSVLRMQQTHGNAYVRRMLGRVQREVNQAAVTKIEGYVAGVPGIPDNFPGAFDELNRLSLADAGDTLSMLLKVSDSFNGLLNHFAEARNIDVGKLESAFLSAIIKDANPAHPSDQTLDWLAKALFVSRDGLTARVMGLPDGWRNTIINAVPTIAHGSVRGETPEDVGGVRYVVQNSYDWQLTATQIRVIVKFKFTGENNPTVVQNWFSRIRQDWNVFKAANSADASKSVDIEFDPQIVGSGQHHSVEIKSGGGRDDEGHWYLGATAGDEESMRMATHEFGHTVGLKDEYQLTHGAYVATVGAEPPAGVTAGDAPPATIAQELHEAIHTGVFQLFSGNERADKATAVIQRHHLAQGQFAQSVATAYNNTYHVGLVDDIVDKLPTARQFWVVNPFTFSNPSVMGSQDDHSHPVLARHVRDFVALVQKARGGTWEAKSR